MNIFHILITHLPHSPTDLHQQQVATPATPLVAYTLVKAPKDATSIFYGGEVTL